MSLERRLLSCNRRNNLVHNPKHDLVAEPRALDPRYTRKYHHTASVMAVKTTVTRK
jgi:hypothetical protein